MSNRRFEMYQYRQMIVRLRLGETIRSIARSGLAGRHKIKAIRQVAVQQGWLDPQNPLPTDEVLAQCFPPGAAPQPAIRSSSVLPYQDQVKVWYQQGIQASTIHATLLREHSFNGSYDAVRRFVKKLKQSTSTQLVTTILDFKPGECAQVDFGAGPKIWDEQIGEAVPTWIFVMVLAWSRHHYAEIVRRQDVITWLGCHRRAFEWFGGVPGKMIIDNCKCAITRACYYDPQVQRAYGDLAESYGFCISACPPREPKKKGRVESGVKYVKNNFVPLREFRDLTNANQELKQWVLAVAGNRLHGSTHEKPLTRFTLEKTTLKALPEKPVELVSWHQVKVHHNGHVVLDKSHYSVPYQLVGQILWLRAGETSVRIYQEHELVALHPRLFQPGSHHSLPDHASPNVQAYAMQTQDWCLKTAHDVGLHCEQLVTQLFADKVLDRLRAAQGILQLRGKYGVVRLDAACQRALAFNSLHYRTVKSILVNGAEYSPLPVEEAFDTLAETYTGKGRYGRNPSTLLQ